MFSAAEGASFEDTLVAAVNPVVQIAEDALLRGAGKVAPRRPCPRAPCLRMPRETARPCVAVQLGAATLWSNLYLDSSDHHT